MLLAALFIIITSFFFFLKLIIFVACFFKYLRNFFIQFLPLYTSCSFSIFLNEDTIDIEKPDGICWLTFVVDKFYGLFLPRSIFSIMH